MTDETPVIESWDMSRTLVYGALALIGTLFGFVFLVAGWQTFTKGAPTTEVWAAVTGLIGFATGVVTTIIAFRFGTSRSSGLKDDTVNQLVAQAGQQPPKEPQP